MPVVEITLLSSPISVASLVPEGGELVASHPQSEVPVPSRDL